MIFWRFLHGIGRNPGEAQRVQEEAHGESPECIFNIGFFANDIVFKDFYPSYHTFNKRRIGNARG